MRLALGLVSPLLLIAAALDADVINCKNGRTYTAVITSENDRAVTANLYGSELEIPRGDIASIKRDTPEQNAAFVKGWQDLEEKYQSEANVRAAENEAAPPPPEPTTNMSPLIGERPQDESQVIIFPAHPPSARQPVRNVPAPPPNKEQKELDRIRQVRKAIHDKQVIPGMTPKEVTAAWGWPDWTHQVGGVNITTDRWVYQREGEGPKAVNFREGKVVSIETPRGLE